MTSWKVSALLVLACCCFTSHAVSSTVQFNGGNFTLPKNGLYRVHVNMSSVSATLDHFWTSTGFCPPLPHEAAGSWFLTSDMTNNLAFIGAIPFKGIEQVRVHFLLNAITVNSEINGIPEYNFTLLDKFVDHLWIHELRPGFEIMGNPSGWYSDFENRTQVELWSDLVRQIGKRYIDKYGIGYVSKWNFESWNEPKVRHFDSIKFSIQGFLNYYDACSEGLKKADPRLILGGPGGACNMKYDTGTSYCWALLDHIQNGINYFTGERGVRIDYVSFHRKGEEPNNTDAIFAKELVGIAELTTNLPKLAKVPFVNDEADPLVTWSRDRWWRSDATYAAMVAKVIIQHQNRWLSKPHTAPIHYKLLSNDNGFLSYNPNYFSQRTLLARFQMNNTMPQHVHFIRKPVHSVMGLLALMGDVQLQATVEDHAHIQLPDPFGVFAAVHPPNSFLPQDSWQLSVLTYFSADSYSVFANANLELNFSPKFPAELDIRWVAYQIDMTNANPNEVWIQAGRPKTPSWKVFQSMRQHEDPVRMLGPRDFIPEMDNSISWPIALPGVVMFHYCAKSKQPPGQVTMVSILNITSDQVLLTWSDSSVHSKCIKTYEVQFAPMKSADAFRRVNTHDTIFTSFVFAPDPQLNKAGIPDGQVQGFYHIRAIDYWNRAGKFSSIIPYAI